MSGADELAEDASQTRKEEEGSCSRRRPSSSGRLHLSADEEASVDGVVLRRLRRGVLGSDDDSAGAAWAAGAEGVGAAAAGAGTAYAAGGHSAELDYNGPELAHSAELDYQGGSNEMV